MKHFEVKKWVRSQTAQGETVTFDKLLQHAKQHEATVKDFHWYKSNGGAATATTIDEIRTFKHRKGQGQRAKGNQGKICGRCGMSHPPRECPAWGKKCHKCGNKNHFSTQCRSKQSGAGNRKSHSTSRGCKGRGKPHCSRSRSKLATKSAYSIESTSFQDHSDDLHGKNTDHLHGERGNLHGNQREQLHGESADLHGNQRENIHGTNSFQDHLGSTDFLKQSFSTISRSKSVASISNDTDPEGKTKILTVLQIKLPHCNGIDDITVKVDDGAEGNILPLNSFRAMFPHALDTNGYPKPGFLRGSKTTLECYNDGKLINHGSIKLRLQHYSEKSFQDHSFYIVETKTPKPIIVGHPASIRLGLIWVCSSNWENRKQLQKLLSRPSTKDRWQTPWKWQRSKSESLVHSFQDHSDDFHGENGNKCPDKDSFKTIHQKSGKSVLSRPYTKCAKNEPKSGSFKTIKSQNVQKRVLSRPLRMDPKTTLLSRPWVKMTKNQLLSRPLQIELKTLSPIHGPHWWGESSHFRS